MYSEERPGNGRSRPRAVHPSTSTGNARKSNNGEQNGGVAFSGGGTTRLNCRKSQNGTRSFPNGKHLDGPRIQWTPRIGNHRFQAIGIPRILGIGNRSLGHPTNTRHAMGNRWGTKKKQRENQR